MIFLRRKRVTTDLGGPLHRSRAERHMTVDIVALRKRRAKNKAATRSRRINRKAAQR